MSMFCLTINIGNEAMQSADDIADALDAAAMHVRERREYPCMIKDVNGNNVGIWQINTIEVNQ